MAAYGVHFEPTDLEIITFLLKRITGLAGDDGLIKKGSWLMTEYVLPDAAIKNDGIKEEYKNFALCVLKKKKTKIVVKPCVGSGLGDSGVECSCSYSCGVEAPIADFGHVGPKEVEIDEDWIRELEESIIMGNHHDDVIKGREEGDSSPVGVFPLVDDDDDDWIHELEESMMDHDNCEENGLVGKMDGIGEPMCDDDPSFEKELLDLFDFDLPADDMVCFFWQDQSSMAPWIAGS